METKICSRCKVAKPLTKDNFYQSNRKDRKDKWHAYCKQCQLTWTVKHQRDFKAQCVAYKGGRCFDCGLKAHQNVYDFHHRDPTKKDVAISRYRHYNFSDKVKLELDKCDLLCSNCHRLRHI